jgi:putative sigma-54 modulation protein
MSYELEITSRNMEVTDRIREYIDKKVSKLDRFFDDIDEIKVDLAFVKSVRSSTDRNVAQITARGKGFILRSEERSEEIFAAFDVALEKMQRQIERYKGKRQKSRIDKSSSVRFEDPLEEYKELNDVQVIARRKEFELIPMSEEEGLEQMRLLSHENFFIFYNMERNAINVLYKRRDGTYGIIEPFVRK